MVTNPNALAPSVRLSSVFPLCRFNTKDVRQNSMPYGTVAEDRTPILKLKISGTYRLYDDSISFRLSGKPSVFPLCQTSLDLSYRAGENSGNRTHDTVIKGHVLYRLSYILIHNSMRNGLSGRVGYIMRCTQIRTKHFLSYFFVMY